MTAVIAQSVVPIGDPIALEEDERTYIYPGGHSITLYNVRELIVRESGSHRIKTLDGKLTIVSSGWLAIQITDLEKGDWTI